MTKPAVPTAVDALNHYESLIETNPMAERKGAPMLHPPVVPSASKVERQRRSIYKPRVDRASGLPWERSPCDRSTLKGLRLPIPPRLHGTDATLSGLLGHAPTLTQGRRQRANPGLYDRILWDSPREAPPRFSIPPSQWFGRAPCARPARAVVDRRGPSGRSNTL